MTITTPIAALFEMIFPILLAAWFVRRYRVGWRPVIAGALAFLGSQVIHLPVLYGLTAAFQNGTLPAPPFAYHVLFNAVLLGLLAGLFEQTANLIAFYFLKDSARSWESGTAVGIGHGAAESSLFVGLPVLVTFISMLILQSNPDALSPSAAGNLHGQVLAYFSQPWHLPLAGIVERLAAITAQVALALIVMQVFLRRNALYFVAAVLWQAAFDAGTVLMAQTGWGIWAIEGMLALTIPLNLAIIFAAYRRTPPAPRVTGEPAAGV